MAGPTSAIEEYEFTHKYRGLALIFINEFFDDPNVKHRKGADKDQKKMENMFKNLDFNVKTYKDLPAKKIKEKLQQAADCKNNEESDCFVCVFSTHGSEEKQEDWKQRSITWKNAIYGRDCTPLLVDDILNMFGNTTCSGLAHKPKLFFIQACRSRNERGDRDTLYDMGCLDNLIRTNKEKETNNSDSPDEVDQLGDMTRTTLKFGVQETESQGPQFDPTDLGDVKNIDDLYKDWSEEEDPDEISNFQNLQQARGDVEDEGYEEDSEGEEDDIDTIISTDKPDAGGGGDSGATPDRPQELTPINCPNDCLVLYPVMPGRIALRSKDEGSWMLHFMHKNLPFLIHNFLLMPYLTKVCSDVAKRKFLPAPLNTNIVDSRNWIQTKAAAHIVHRLSKNVRFVPKKSNSLMAIWFRNLFPKIDFLSKFKW